MTKLHYYFTKARGKLNHYLKARKLRAAIQQTTEELNKHSEQFHTYGNGWWGRAQEIVERRQQAQASLREHLLHSPSN